MHDFHVFTCTSWLKFDNMYVDLHRYISIYAVCTYNIVSKFITQQVVKVDKIFVTVMGPDSGLEDKKAKFLYNYYVVKGDEICQAAEDQGDNFRIHTEN